MLSFLIVVNTVIIGALGFDVGRYSLALILMMVVFLISPLIPDFFVHQKRVPITKLLGYAGLNFIVYASLVPMMICTVTLALLGKKAKFIVTPKEERKLTFKDAVLGCYDSLIFAFIIGLATYTTYFSLMPTLLLVGCCALAPLAVLIANFAIKKPRLYTVRRALY